MRLDARIGHNYAIITHTQKYKCNFDIQENTTFIKKLANLEKNLLSHINIKNKSCSYNLINQINTGFVKIFIDSLTWYEDNPEIILKISGIWESETEYGITFKFIISNHL